MANEITDLPIAAVAAERNTGAGLSAISRRALFDWRAADADLAVEDE
jgi:hypothetical protein